MSPLGLFIPFFIAAGPASTGLQKGDELTYTGTIAEAIERPGKRFRRLHDLEIRVFALEKEAGFAECAVLTLLKRRPDWAIASKAAIMTGAIVDGSNTPPAARLDLVRVADDGSVRLLLPNGPAPLLIDAETFTRALPQVPFDSFAPFEFGFLPPRPSPAETKSGEWSSTIDPTRPPENWKLQGFEFVTAERCLRLDMTQQSPGWDRPVGGKSAWQRIDRIWASTDDRTARKVRRSIQHRDGLSEAPAVWIEVSYDLKEQGRVIGRSYERSRREIETAYAAAVELASVLPDSSRLGGRPFAAQLAKLDHYLAQSEPGTPYREAVLAVRRQLVAACAGEAAPIAPCLKAPFITRGTAPDSPATLAIGHAAPDFRAGTFHLSEHRGRPIVLAFFKPETKTTDLALAIAAALTSRYGDRLDIVPLIVYGDSAAALKDCQRLRLNLACHNGAAAQTAYRIETFPRFMVIDGEGTLRWTFTGVGAETGSLIRDQIEALLAPAAGKVAPSGTSYPTDAPSTVSP